jgi:hypothetical protein
MRLAALLVLLGTQFMLAKVNEVIFADKNSNGLHVKREAGIAGVAAKP